MTEVPLKPKNIQCKSCLKHVLCNEPPPVRGPRPWNDIWICLWCESTVCIDCFTNHGVKRHPEQYHLPVPFYEENDEQPKGV